MRYAAVSWLAVFSLQDLLAMRRATCLEMHRAPSCRDTQLNGQAEILALDTEIMARQSAMTPKSREPELAGHPSQGTR